MLPRGSSKDPRRSTHTLAINRWVLGLGALHGLRFRVWNGLEFEAWGLGQCRAWALRFGVILRFSCTAKHQEQTGNCGRLGKLNTQILIQGLQKCLVYGPALARWLLIAVMENLACYRTALYSLGGPPTL